MIFQTCIRRSLLIALIALLAAPALGELKGTNATFKSWDDGSNIFRNSNSAIVLDGKWHPFFADLNFDGVAVDPAAPTQSNGVVQCSTVDTDGNGLVGTSTPWAGTLQLSVDHIDTGVTPFINGFRETRCWELAVCDREGNGTGDQTGSDDSVLPRYRRFAIDVTASEGVCPTPTANASQGWVNPVVSNGFITLLAKDVPAPCSQAGRCDQVINTNLYITLDRDCDGFIDDNDGVQVNNDPAEGDLSLIGSGGAGRIPLPVGNNDPQVCFFAEGKKPDFTVTPQWTGNIQARITAPAGSSGDKTVNHSIIASPAAGDVGDLPAAYLTAAHVTNAITGNPFIGGPPDSDTAYFSTVLADGDDLNGSFPPDEDGVILPPDSSSDNDGSDIVYTATVNATNNSGTTSQLCGWFDFNQSFSLDNTANISTTSSDPDFATRVETGERSCVAVPTGTNGQNFFISWTIPEADRDRSGNFYFRFRISSDLDMFDSVLLSHFLGMTSGEVEDYLLENVGSLPVSIASFHAVPTPKGLQIDWVTTSETENIGFHVWATGRDRLERLTTAMIPAHSDGDLLTPRRYRIVLPEVDGKKIGDLAITAVDTRGREEMYGLFDIDQAYGQEVEPELIPWQAIRDSAAERSEFVRLARSHARASTAAGASAFSKRPPAISPDALYVDLEVHHAGLQAISQTDLAAAGLDLTGVPVNQIAITLKGDPVARDIVTSRGIAKRGKARFAAGDEIRFWGASPAIPDKIYIEQLVYRVELDSTRSREAATLARPANGAVSSYIHWDRRDEDVSYNFSSPLDDPWYAALLRADRVNRFETQFELDSNLIPSQPGRVVVTIAGLTDFPEDPDHHVRIEVNGSIVGEMLFEGQSVHRLELDVPPGVLQVGNNVVTVRAPGSTAAAFDLFLVDTVELGWPRQLVAIDGRIHIEQDSATGFRLSGLDLQSNPIGYAFGNGELTAIKVARAGDGYTVSPAPGATDYWVSDAGRLHRPIAAQASDRVDLLAGRSGDFLIIAHPAFMPISSSEFHPLNRFMQQRRADGWTPELFDITEIQREFGHGMALPEALTSFLQAADRAIGYEHVLLVGGDSYDYTDKLGLGSVSFIPTRYVATSFIRHTPSDALMADLDGDGFPDKAVGRWPVRNVDDLNAIVTKTLDWPATSADQGIVWVTDSEDPAAGSFRDQAERMIETALDAGWPENAVSRVYWGDTTALPGESVAAASRRALFDSLEQGRALTGFVGHGAPSMWTFQGLLRPRDIAELENEGKPTLIGTLTCYTSYFVSPTAESVAHRWMNGYRKDAQGNQIPGVANGAVAIHGAATLSDYGGNEVVARAILEAQLSGMTLGQAVEAGRLEALKQSLPDLIRNWALLGDPTLRLQ